MPGVPGIFRILGIPEFREFRELREFRECLEFQEFREWILCIGEHPEMLEDSVMSLKQSLGKRQHLRVDTPSEDTLEI